MVFSKGTVCSSPIRRRISTASNRRSINSAFEGLPVVVADTGPPHYLVLIGAVHLLPQLFDTVVLPDVVCNELRHLRTPKSVRDWLATDPPWLKAMPTPEVTNLPLPKLGDGDRAAIALARSIRADLILMDDRAATAIALQEEFSK